MNFQPNAPPVAIANTAPTATQQIGKALDNVKGSLTNTFDEFSSQASAGVGATTEFLTSNTIIAKFAFILLILVVFLILKRNVLIFFFNHNKLHLYKRLWLNK